jgi:outer membrane protein OmpA-like peptidoglycan-associated protein
MIALLGLVSCSCSRGVFKPVNTGREYGDPVPIMVSHIGKGSPHYILQNVLCFDYMCRLGAGKKKAMRQISFADFKKRIEKNAKQGKYKNLTPPRPRRPKKDSVALPKDTLVIVPVIAGSIAAPGIQADSLIVLSDLLFELNSAHLHDEHVTVLDSLAAFLSTHRSIYVSVTGHTDSTGAERHNVGLSTRRAEGVSDYLVAKGVSLDRITFEGLGSSRPISSNRTENGRKRNRRVEILLKKPEP